jgi:PTS system nitrogen regulatory IIA component
MNNEKLMTLQDVAEFLQIKERTVYDWAKKGKIPGFKLGNVWRFKPEDLNIWIEEQKQDSPRSHALKRMDVKK